MAKFTWFDGNQGVYRYRNFNEHSIKKMNAKKIELQFDETNNTFDPTRSPYSITIKIKKGALETYEDGPNAGQKALIAGTVVGVDFFGKSGNKLVKVSGLDLSASAIWAWLVDAEPWQIDNYIWSGGGHTFIGSDDGSGPNQGWDGDDMKTSFGDDKVKSGKGDDYVTDMGGSDKYDLGAGDYDAISYDEWYWNPGYVLSGIKADLSKGKIKGPDGHTDTVTGVELVRGTFLDDMFVGNDKDNEFMGFNGSDTFDGGAGFDWVDFRREIDQGGRDGVRVNLEKGIARDAFRNKDTLINIEGAEGTDQNDKFTGDKNNNWFRGRDGADQFIFEGKKFGYDFVDDFSRSEGDKMHITAAKSFSDLKIDYDSQSGHAIVTFGKSTIEVQDWVANNPGVNLIASDFVFG